MGLKKQSKQQPEYALQCQVAEYLTKAYPKVRFMSDTIASVKLTIPQQVRNKKIQCPDFKCPDLLIFASREVDGEKFSGLFIELKAESPYKVDGKTLKSNEHIEAQSRDLDRLSAEGYFCLFCWDFNKAKEVIDKYLKSPNF
jgi:hypothetical protein